MRPQGAAVAAPNQVAVALWKGCMLSEQLTCVAVQIQGIITLTTSKASRTCTRLS